LQIFWKIALPFLQPPGGIRPIYQSPAFTFPALKNPIKETCVFNCGGRSMEFGIYSGVHICKVVTPAEAGVQDILKAFLDSGLRRNDGSADSKNLI